MSSSSIFVILAIVVYLVGMILIGYRHSKGTNTSSDSTFTSADVSLARLLRP